MEEACVVGAAADIVDDGSLRFLIDQQVAAHPEREAIREVKDDSGTSVARQWTFAQWDCAASILAAHLVRRLHDAIPWMEAKKSVGPVVGIAILHGYEAVVAILASWKAGLCFLPIDLENPRGRFVLSSSFSHLIDIVIGDTVSAPKAVALGFEGPVITYDERSEIFSRDDCIAVMPMNKSTAESACCIICTSGSTGRPKPVVISHGALRTRFEWMHRTFPFQVEVEKTCQTKPLTAVDSIWETFGGLTAGVTLVVFPPIIRTDMCATAKCFEQEQITRWMTIPSVLDRMLDLFQAEIFNSMRIISVSGEPLKRTTSQKFFMAFDNEINRPQLLNLYGATEVAADVTCFNVEYQLEDCSDTTAISRRCRYTSIGSAIDGSTVLVGKSFDDGNGAYVDGTTIQIAESGANGEILVSGKSMMLGYVTAGTDGILGIESPPDKIDWFYRTGDFGFHVNGKLFCTGRCSQFINRLGNRVSPLEIESLVLDLGHDVDECCIVESKTDNGSSIVVAFVVPEAVDTAILHRKLVQNAPPYMVPNKIVARQSLPSLYSGKVDRSLLSRQGEGHCTPHPEISQMSTLETVLWQLLKEILQTEFDPNAILMDLGIDSLSAMVLKFRLNERLRLLLDKGFPGFSFDFEQIEHLNVGEFSTFLTTSAGCPVSVIEKLQPCFGGTLLEGCSSVAPSKSIMERDDRGVKNTSQLYLGGIDACARGDIAALRKCIENGWDASHAIDKNESTALMWAAGAGNLKIASILLAEFGMCMDVNRRNKQGRTALFQAAKHGHVNMAKFLLHDDDNSASLEFTPADPFIKMADGSSVFDWAVWGGNLAAVEYFNGVLGPKAHESNRFGCNAPFWAAMGGNVLVAKWMLARGFDFAHLNNSNHGTVNQAAWKGQRKILEWLLLAPLGPKLGWQLLLRDREHNETTMEALRAVGRNDEAAWLDSQFLKMAPSLGDVPDRWASCITASHDACQT